MVTIKKVFNAAILALLVVSCSNETIRVSDEIITREYNFDNISALEVATDFKAYVTFSETEESVKIQANENLFGRINVLKEGGRLRVKLDDNISIRGKETLNVFITTQNITDFKASSDSEIYLDMPLTNESVAINLSSDAYFEGEITTKNLEISGTSDSKVDVLLTADEANINLSSGADLEGECKVGKATFKLSSDSTVDLQGTITTMNAILSSDSKLKDYGLNIEDLKISLSSDSDSYVTVSKTIDVTANSDSRLFYKGDAEIINQNLSSDGKVIKE
ncbi:MAG: DUF2807 domain-containing protein [Bacteroidota bacterium]